LPAVQKGDPSKQGLKLVGNASLAWKAMTA